jgi:VanZ family protein
MGRNEWPQSVDRLTVDIVCLRLPLSRPVSFGRLIKSWLPVLLWMAVIFAGSTNLGSPQNTSRFIGPFLRWLNPDISNETINAIQFFIRKCAHGTEYGMLAFLAWRARRSSQLTEKKSWHWMDAFIAILIAAFYAATDEFHQSFVSTRQASAWDVGIDTTGAAVTMILLYTLGRWRKWW